MDVKLFAISIVKRRVKMICNALKGELDKLKRQYHENFLPVKFNFEKIYYHSTNTYNCW
jgi:hypothetical protein